MMNDVIQIQISEADESVSINIQEGSDSIGIEVSESNEQINLEVRDVVFVGSSSQTMTDHYELIQNILIF